MLFSGVIPPQSKLMFNLAAVAWTSRFGGSWCHHETTLIHGIRRTSCESRTGGGKSHCCNMDEVPSAVVGVCHVTARTWVEDGEMP
jgi:hypothetical protein